MIRSCQKVANAGVVVCIGAPHTAVAVAWK
jgi:hypothetical protein